MHLVEARLQNVFWPDQSVSPTCCPSVSQPARNALSIIAVAMEMAFQAQLPEHQVARQNHTSSSMRSTGSGALLLYLSPNQLQVRELLFDAISKKAVRDFHF
jgi:hypothetical protein